MKLISSLAAVFVGTSLIDAGAVQASAPPHCDAAAKKDYNGTCYAGNGDLYENYLKYQEGRQPYEKGGSSFK